MTDLLASIGYAAFVFTVIGWMLFITLSEAP